MRTKFNGILTLLLAFVVQATFAQKTITGTVTDDMGPIPSASVMVKGTTNGTATDFDGKYSITAKAGDVLVFSFVGMQTVEKTVGTANVINATLGVNELEGLVVVAQSIKRNPREIAAAVTTVKASELVASAPVDAAKALTGKVSSLNITTGNNSVSSETSIIIRGNTSLLNNNGALIVIDGFISAASAINDLNPDDIESTTVLKSASAAVLYGSKGANGVLIITTKSGKKGQEGFAVTLNTSMDFNAIKMLPTMQKEYGSGWDGVYDLVENTNWGPRFDGVVRPTGPELIIDGQLSGTWNQQRYEDTNNVENFFDTGISSKTGISISNKSKDGSVFFSARRDEVTGVIAKDRNERNNFRFAVTKQLGKLSVRSTVSFIANKLEQVATEQSQGRSIYWNILNQPNNLDLSRYKNWETDVIASPDNFPDTYYENPWMLIDKNRAVTNSNRTQGNIALTYALNDNINASYTIGVAQYNSDATTTRDAIVYTRPSRLGSSQSARVDKTNYRNVRFSSDVRFDFDYDFGDINMKTSIGQNAVSFYSNSISVGGRDLIVPDFYDVSTRTGEPIAGDYTVRERDLAAYITSAFTYKKAVTFDLKYRQDWTSTLITENNSFGYYSAGISSVLTDAFPNLKSEKLRRLKLYVNYATVGNGTSAYRNQETFSVPGGFPYGSTVGFGVSSVIVSQSLQPEMSTEKEIGFEAELFNGIVTFNGAYYIKNSTDQLLQGDVSAAAGAYSLFANQGELQNKGLEFDLSVRAINKENFKWTVSGNYTNIKNEVLSLNGDNQALKVYGFNDAALYAVVGKPFPQIRTSAYQRDPQGRVIVDAVTGNPLKDAALKDMGTAAAPTVIGLTNSFRYKDFSLRVVTDYKTGHVFFNGLVNALEFTGRIPGRTRQAFVFPNSSYESAPGVYTANTSVTTGAGNPMLYESFWGEVYGDIKENYVLDASAFKVREVSFTYTVPSKKFTGKSVKGLSVSLVGRDIFMALPKANIYTDPEFYSGNMPGIGNYTQTPPTASYGFAVKVKF